MSLIQTIGDGWLQLSRYTAILLLSTLVGCQSPPSPVESPIDTEADVRPIDELLLFFPNKFPNGDWAPKNLQFEDVYFKSEDGTTLHGWYCPCKHPQATILLSHGNAGHIADRSAWLAHLQQQVRVAVFAYDYRGYGRSEGKPSVEGAIQDAIAAREKLCDLANLQSDQIVLMGESLGGAISIQLAAASPAKALIIQSSFSSLRDVANVHYPKVAWLVPKDKLDSVGKIPQHKGPLLLSHGDLDTVIPLKLGQQLFSSANEPKQFVLIRGANHNDAITPRYVEALKDFLANLDK